MKTLLRNIYKAPKSTLVAICVLVSLTVLKHFGTIENDTYGSLAAIVIPILFTDLLKEKKGQETE